MTKKFIYKTREQRQLWWSNLSAEEQSSFIEKKERSRVTKRIDRTGQQEVFKNGLVKIWYSVDSYTIYKPDMLDEDGIPLPQWRH